jgi:hypothetical protein
MGKEKSIISSISNELAPCGVYCGACPSFGKSCFGCASASRKQKRKSKWACKIRSCCYEEMGLSFCGNCAEFPCTRVNNKLIRSHPGEAKFKYRHEIAENTAGLIDMGPDAYLAYQKERWACPICGGRVVFYEYRCVTCGEEVLV